MPYALNDPESVLTLSAHPVPTPSVWAPDAAGAWRDYYNGGKGRIAATVKQKGTPNNTPVVRLVRLHKMRNGILIAETWSGETGAYSFEYLELTEKYYAVAFDHFGNYRGVVADNLTPEPM